MGIVLISMDVTTALTRGRALVFWPGDFHRTRNCFSSERGKSKAFDLQKGGAGAPNGWWWPLVKHRLHGWRKEACELLSAASVWYWHRFSVPDTFKMALVRLPWPREQQAVLQNCWRRKHLCIPTERNPCTETSKFKGTQALQEQPGSWSLSPASPDAASTLKNPTAKWPESLCSVFPVQVWDSPGLLMWRWLSGSKVNLASLPRNAYWDVCTSYRPWLALGHDSSDLQKLIP